MAKHHDVVLTLDAQAILAEGPLWDSQDAALWWVDIEGGELHCYDPATGTDQSYTLGERVGTVVRRTGDGVTLGLQSGVANFDPATQALQGIACPEPDRPQHRFNDGKCDAAGRLWVGSMNFRDERLPTGTLYSIDAEHNVREHVTGVKVSNGLVWTQDATIMYYIDSPTRRIDAFDFDVARGELRHRRPVYTVPDGWGFPDGMAVDANDHLWVALWGGWGVLHIDPQRGEVLQRIDVPASQVTACALGGADLRDLYITTARRGLSDAELLEQPHAGGIFRTRVQVPGVPSFRFAG